MQEVHGHEYISEQSNLDEGHLAGIPSQILGFVISGLTRVYVDFGLKVVVSG